MMILAASLSLCAGVLTTTPSAYCQSSAGSFDWLSLETLQALKVHLPSYMSSVQAQMAYQAKVPLHQEITVAWSPNAGGQSSAGPGFVVVKRWQHMQKTASQNELNLKTRPVLVIGATRGGEVRALALHADMRATSGQFDLQLPQDGQMSKLIFVSIDSSGFEPLGEVELSLPNIATQRISKAFSGQTSLSK
jgi:hypothetical protein